MIRRFEEDRDLEDVARIWREIGWLAASESATEAFETIVKVYDGWVAEVDGDSECYVGTTAGTMIHDQRELSSVLVGAVTTGRVARRRGLATKLTARAMQEALSGGAEVAMLGMFEQGFYDRLGFGTGSPLLVHRFTPTQLKVPRLQRPPRRLGQEDWSEVHTNRIQRRRRHGGVSWTKPEYTKAEMNFWPDSFGLGFEDGPDGGLSHHLWLTPMGGAVDGGPYQLMWMAFETYEQLVELLSVLESLGDQVRQLIVPEPPGLRLQDFVKGPIHHQELTEGAKFELGIRASAQWQLRICNLKDCIEKTVVAGADEVRFNLELHDPVEAYCDPENGWSGVGGTYVVSLGSSSSVRAGRDAELSTMRAGVGAFSRWWSGVAPATTLAVSDRMKAPQWLLETLDRKISWSNPVPDWDL